MRGREALTTMGRSSALTAGFLPKHILEMRARANSTALESSRTVRELEGLGELKTDSLEQGVSDSK